MVTPNARNVFRMRNDAKISLKRDRRKKLISSRIISAQKYLSFHVMTYGDLSILPIKFLLRRSIALMYEIDSEHVRE